MSISPSVRLCCSSGPAAATESSIRKHYCCSIFTNLGGGTEWAVGCCMASHAGVLATCALCSYICQFAAEEREGTAGWAAVVGAVEAHEGVRWKCILFDWPDYACQLVFLLACSFDSSLSSFHACLFSCLLAFLLPCLLAFLCLLAVKTACPASARAACCKVGLATSGCSGAQISA